MSTYEISKSSLLSLKAEILRKQDELTKVRSENNVKIRNLKKNAPLDLKNKGLKERQEAQDLNEEEENLLRKSREILEAKSKLYDKLSKTGVRDEAHRRFLVRFRPNDDDEDLDFDHYEPPKNRDEEWVEYVDCLGRTRTCLRKDLDYLKSKDKDLKLIVDEKKKRHEELNPGKELPKPPPPPPPKEMDENELLSNDMRREALRKQWEKEEEDLKDKSNIHYQDILFSEARTHGVGYYGFSKDEDERLKQQEALKKLREETERQQKKSQDMKSMRERQLKARVLAAKNRKRERMGLPPLTEDDMEEEKKEEAVKETVEEISETELKKEEKRKKHIRPWDFGKKGVKEHYEHSQEEWVDKKRRERVEEFAPPSTYRKRFEPQKIRNELSDDSSSDDDRRGTEVAPPSTYDYYGPSSSKRTKRQPEDSMLNSIEAGLKYLRQQMENKDF